MPQHLLQSILIGLGVFIIALIISWKLGKIWQGLLKSLNPSESLSKASITPPYTQPITQTPANKSSSSLHLGLLILLTLVRVIIWIVALGYITSLFAQTRQWGQLVINLLKSSLVADILPLGNKSYSVIDLFVLVGLLIGLVVLSKTISRILQSKLLSATGLNRSVQDTTALMVNYSLIFFGTIVVLQVWGLDLSSLTVFASVLGVGIGLGLQGIAKEFVSGLVLIFERPIQVGDFVEVSGLMGTVERIGARSTEIRTLDHVSVILPNSRFLESEVINWSHSSPISRLKIPLGVAYNSNLDLVKTILIKIAKNHKEVLSSPSPLVIFTSFGDSCLNINLLVWISKPYKQFKIKSDLYFEIDAKFREEKIEIPFPQQDVNFRSGDLSPNVSIDLMNSLAELSKSLASWLDTQSPKSQETDRDQDKN